ncbi:hypothetical protein [Vibrio phage XZ1]|nr:hypothetical protein [Vibrio phage XZ1]
MEWLIFSGVCACIAIYLTCKKDCKHDWMIVKDETTKSSGEVYGEMTGKVPTPRNSYHMQELTSRKRIIIMTCVKCGKIDKTVETI